MKLIKVLSSAILFVLIASSNAMAYIGLCCAHCGGNMPLNIPGGGIPETHEFRFKLSQMYMYMDSLRDGTDEKNYSDYGPSTAAEKYRVAAPASSRTFRSSGTRHQYTEAGNRAPDFGGYPGPGPC